MFLQAKKIEDIKLDIGVLIKSYRKKEKISQEDLAIKLSLSRITIQNLESGKNFTIDTLLKVLQYFDLLNKISFLLDEKIKENKDYKSLY